MYCRGYELLATLERGKYRQEDCLSVYAVGRAFLVVTRNRLLLLRRRKEAGVAMLNVVLNDCVEVYVENDAAKKMHCLYVSVLESRDLFDRHAKKSHFALKMSVVRVRMGSSETALKIASKLNEIVRSEMINHDYGKHGGGG